MNQEHFLLTLKIHLHDLSQDSRDAYLKQYEEKFTQGLAENKKEEAISQELGDPQKIAIDILAENGIFYQEKNTSYANNGWQEFTDDDYTIPNYQKNNEQDLENDRQTPGTVKVGRLLLSLGFNFIFVWFIFTFLIMCLTVAAIGIFLSLMAFAGIIGLIFTPNTLGLFIFFLCLLCTGIGLLICSAIPATTKGIVRSLGGYLNTNIRFIRGGK